jgi:transposase-like protein
MNDKITISLMQLFKLFPDQESARLYLESRLWPTGVCCPTCGLVTGVVSRGTRPGYYRCPECGEFTVRTGTIFERSHIPLHKWLYAMYLLVTGRKGISSMQLSKEIDVTQKSAWFMLQRLREACSSDIDKLGGIDRMSIPEALKAITKYKLSRNHKKALAVRIVTQTLYKSSSLHSDSV